jgi:hypothetical protein
VLQFKRKKFYFYLLCAVRSWENRLKTDLITTLLLMIAFVSISVVSPKLLFYQNLFSFPVVEWLPPQTGD